MAVVAVWDYQVKRGDAKKMVALLQAATAEYRLPPGTPTFLSMKTYAPSDTRFVQMIEWESYTAMSQWYAAFAADRVGVGFWRNWHKVKAVTRGAEYWDVLPTPEGWPAPKTGTGGIVEVHDWQVKIGDAEKIVALIGDTLQKLKLPADTPQPLSMGGYAATWTRLVFTIQWKSLGDMEQYYAAFGADPAGKKYWNKVAEFVVADNGSGIWDVLEMPTESQEC